MKKTISCLLIFLILIVLTLFQSNKEDLTLGYRWGLHDTPPSHKDKDIYIRDDSEYRPEFRPEYRKEGSSWFDNLFKKKETINSGSYKCYYEPDEDNQCAELLKQCPIQTHPDLSNYILKSEIPPQVDMTNYILKSEIPPQMDLSEYVKKDEIPEQVDMSEYIHKKDIKKYIRDCPNCEECPTCPIPLEKETEEIDLSKYMLKTECKKNNSEDNKDSIDFGDIIPSFMKQKSQCKIEDDMRRQRFEKKC